MFGQCLSNLDSVFTKLKLKIDDCARYLQKLPDLTDFSKKNDSISVKAVEGNYWFVLALFYQIANIYKNFTVTKKKRMFSDLILQIFVW